MAARSGASLQVLRYPGHAADLHGQRALSNWPPAHLVQSDMSVSEGEKWVTEMSDADLRDLFRLGDAPPQQQ